MDRSYAYRIDLRLGVNGRTETRKDVKRLTPLPSDAKPLILFLGVREDGKESVFLVDSERLSHSGEGRCKPSPTSCSLLYLREDTGSDTHAFTDEQGSRYELRLLDIHLDRLRASSTDSEPESSDSTAGSDPSSTDTGRSPSTDSGDSGSKDAEQESGQSNVEKRLKGWFSGFFDILRRSR